VVIRGTSLITVRNFNVQTGCETRTDMVHEQTGDGGQTTQKPHLSSTVATRVCQETVHTLLDDLQFASRRPRCAISSSSQEVEVAV
jgi:hypothetical protein